MNIEKKVTISEDKIIEYNEKAFADTRQLFESISEERLEKFMDNCNQLPDNDLSFMKSAFPSKGKRLYLEVVVEDTYLGSKVFDWLYSKSNFDNSNGLSVFGLKLDAIHHSMPNGYTEEEKYLIKELYKKVIGNE
jgi:hypothetical protein